MTISRMVSGIKKAETLYITPKVEAFLRDVPDGVVWTDEAYETWRSLTQRAMGNDVRSGRFGASSRGMCLRRQVFAFLGMPSYRMIDSEVQNLFNDGKWRHLRWQMMALQAGAITHAEMPYRMDDLRVSGSMDGYNDQVPFGMELKGDRNWARSLDGVPEAHLLQTHTMMLATGMDVFAYVIESKSDQTWREILVRRDKKTMKRVVRELEELNENVEAKKIPGILPACQQKSGPFRSCPFAKQCLAQEEWPEAGKWTGTAVPRRKRR